jgi:transcriptional regulator with XRE-family HTH domain
MFSMTGKQFTDWMKKQGLRVSDVASKTKLDPNTIYKFRRGGSVWPITEDTILRFIQEYERSPAHHGGKRATG